MVENINRVCYGLREIASKDRRECMDWCRIDVSEELGRYGTVTRSLRSDRATFFGLFSDVSCFFRRALRKNKSFPKIYFRKNVHADFYGLSDIDFVVTDFDPNS